MLALCAAAYLFGAAIRRNIRLVEPMMEDESAARGGAARTSSDLALALAYFVSVTYYLNLFASFALRAVGIVDERWPECRHLGIVAALGCSAHARGLHGAGKDRRCGRRHQAGADRGARLPALGLAPCGRDRNGSFALVPIAHPTGLHEIGILLGLVILVQGFETSRYLGDAYDGATRMRTMRYAQWLSTAIYLDVHPADHAVSSPACYRPKAARPASSTCWQPLGSAGGAARSSWPRSPSHLSAAVADMSGRGRAAGRRHGQARARRASAMR